MSLALVKGSGSTPTPLPAPNSAPKQADLPETVIRRRRGWQALDLRELWRHRELLFLLALRDVKVRYKQAVLGGAWALLQPLATMVVFCLFFRQRGDAAVTTDLPYPLFVLAGLLPWTFFANAISASAQSVIGSQGLVTKIYFPRLLIPVGAVLAGLADLAVSSLLLLAIMLYHGVFPGWGGLLLPLLVAGFMTAALGVGMLLAALTVAYRDFRYVVPFLVQLWLLATPSIYLQGEAAVGPLGQALLPLNPAYGLIANFRAAVLNTPPDLYSLAVSAAVSLLLFLVGCLYFRRVERGFADLI
jgi:lipopolysaccharide transport system permease protein